MKGRICYLGNAAATHTQRWVNYFAEHGWKVDLITWHNPKNNNLLHPDICLHKVIFPPHYMARYLCLIEVIFLLRQIRPEIIHAHYLGHFGIIAGLVNRITGFKPIVLTAWGSDILADAKGFKRFLIRYSLMRADLITCDGENSEKAIKDLGIDENKIEIIYHGVDTELFNPTKRNRNFIENFFDGSNYPMVISARSLNTRGNIETLIKAVPLILKVNKNVKFIVVGNGPEEKSLKSLAESMGIAKSIRFVGFVTHNELPKYLASSDVYVSTSLLDGGVAVATLDAMSCGIAPVVTDVADNSKWINDGINGFIIPIREPELLAEKILYLLSNKNIRENFGQICRRKITEKQEYSKNMKKMEDFYNNLIKDVLGRNTIA